MFDRITGNFYEIRPTDYQYREITVTRIRCRVIAYPWVSDPGRSAIGGEFRFTTTEGDCVEYLDVAKGPPVSLRKVTRS
ncbi:MAG: hypothetical protein EA400_12905 [Chromatiaceae bacterium]|nr:MAG: hypothetical protein EA400_12905 [Chromatiaceae bacterium]